MYWVIKVPSTVHFKVLFSVYLLQNFYPISFTSFCSSLCPSRSCVVLLSTFFTIAYCLNLIFFLTSCVLTLLCGQKNNGQRVAYLASVNVVCIFSACCIHKIICFVIFLYQNLSCFQFFQMFLWQRHNFTLRTYCHSLQTFRAKLTVTTSPQKLREMHTVLSVIHLLTFLSEMSLILPSIY